MIRKTEYINDSHQWMDMTILKGRYPDLYGYLVLVDHDIPSSEVWDQLRYWSEKYLNGGPNRTRRFHEIIDEKIQLQMQIDVREGFNPCFCGKGCANCCYQPVACTDEEARLVESYCRENGILIDYEKLKRQTAYIEYDENSDLSGIPAWDTQPHEDQSCVFLNEDDRSCAIWEVRPFVCRVQLAEKTSEYCRSINGIPNPKASAIHYPDCSYIVSAVFSAHHDSIGKGMNRLLINSMKTADDD